jgi:hypothetical protein
MSTYRQTEVKNPHFKLPLQFGGIKGGALVNEQDTAEDKVDCVKAIIGFPVDTRHDMPEFGIPDIVFKQYSEIVIQQVYEAIDYWEPRPLVDVGGEPLLNDQFIWNLLVKVGVPING